MKTKHTPGPWFKDGNFVRSVDDSGLIAELYISPSQCTQRNLSITADAALIAASPEMLEALEQLVFWYDQYRPKVSVRNGDDPSGFIENLDFKINRYREIIAKTKNEAKTIYNKAVTNE